MWPARLVQLIPNTSGCGRQQTDIFRYICTWGNWTSDSSIYFGGRFIRAGIYFAGRGEPYRWSSKFPMVLSVEAYMWCGFSLTTWVSGQRSHGRYHRYPLFYPSLHVDALQLVSSPCIWISRTTPVSICFWSRGILTWKWCMRAPVPIWAKLGSVQLYVSSTFIGRCIRPQSVEAIELW